MNRVYQSDWSSMTLGDLDMLLVGGGVSQDELVAFLALANALVILGSWSSCTKTLGVPQHDWSRA
jgi:hypothetical protein